MKAGVIEHGNHIFRKLKIIKKNDKKNKNTHKSIIEIV